MQKRVHWVIAGFVSAMFLAGCSTQQEKNSAHIKSWPCYSLRAEKFWQLNTPNGSRFDASGLLRQNNGDLLAVNDRDPLLCKIVFPNDSTAADLVPVPDYFSPASLRSFAEEKRDRYDAEGLAQDRQGRIYLCEEANRWILRFDPKTKTVVRLPIDWSPAEKYFHPADHNASFEGIAIGDGKLFVANERQEGRIFVLDLKTFKIIDDFTVFPTKTKMKDIHYSDLCWFENALFAILRENRVVVKIDVRHHTILAEYNFHDMEQAPALAYRVTYPTSTMEGLSVDKDNFWLITDNNGWGRKQFPEDTRPTLFKCPRPDK